MEFIRSKKNILKMKRMNTLPCEKQKRHSGVSEGKGFGKFVFPGLVKSSKGKKSDGKDGFDNGSVSNGPINRCVVVSSSIAMAVKTMERRGHDWFVQASVASDLIVQVGGYNFHLHKLPMVSRSGYLNRLVFQRSNGAREANPSKLQIDNLPGGAETFELVVRFCYGWNVDLTSSNVAPLYCAANFLEMSDDLERGNLVTRAEAFLSFLAFSSWKETFRIMKSCETVSAWAKELQIVRVCSESIALKAWTDLKDFENDEEENWWFEDVSRLRIDHFVEVIQAMKDKGMKASLIGTCVAQWTTQWLSQATFEPHASMAHQLQRVTIECLIRLIPTQENSVTSNFLLQLLKFGSELGINSSLLEALERRIARLLEKCRVSDLLVENRGRNEGVYDVHVVNRVVRAYVACASSNVIIRPKSLVVGRLVDGYLMMIARDDNVEVGIFESLVHALPRDARYCDDNLYRATDTYLKAHPYLTEEERTSLCGFLEYHRLSQEARDHVMKNNRLPLKVSSNFVLLEQVSAATRPKMNTKSAYTRTIVKASHMRASRGWISSRKEIKKMTMEVETMKSQLNDLHKCKLKLFGQLKRCAV